MARDMSKTRRCTDCGIRKVITREFYKNATAKSGYDNICRGCRKVRVRASLERRGLEHRVTYLSEYRRTPHGRAVSMFNQKRAHCRERGIPFDLTAEWVRAKIDAGTCELTGIKFSSLAWSLGTERDPFMFSLDRKDPKGGYTKANTRAVIFAVNIARQEWGDAILHKWAKALVTPKRARAA